MLKSRHNKNLNGKNNFKTKDINAKSNSIIRNKGYKKITKFTSIIVRL